MERLPGLHPSRLTRLPPPPPAAGEHPAIYAQLMRTLEATVRELLAAVQAERKAKLDAGRVDTVFKVGDRMLVWTRDPGAARRLQHW